MQFSAISLDCLHHDKESLRHTEITTVRDMYTQSPCANISDNFCITKLQFYCSKKGQINFGLVSLTFGGSVFIKIS
jgi:hypothetical protein